MTQERVPEKGTANKVRGQPKASNRADDDMYPLLGRMHRYAASYTRECSQTLVHISKRYPMILCHAREPDLSVSPNAR